ncbi:MAG TPA: LCP family protein [Candidatus Polarisedimenticolaceae bacterium]|nr:LCP family protein [Candidatus Polarisedimenticolaceae bacterium]
MPGQQVTGTDAKSLLGATRAAKGEPPLPAKPPRKRLSWSKRRVVVSAAALLVVGIIVAVGIKVVLASHRVVTKNTTHSAPALASAKIDPAKLGGEGDGRINVLLLGIGGDGHSGGALSDTIMVASIDPVHKTVAMLSIPRDLYVRIPGHGASKINAANSYGGPDLTKQVVGAVLDLPIHYYMQVDFRGFKQAVDAVGGVDVANSTKLFDSDFPCDGDHGICPFSLSAGQHHMDGTLALKYARCRHGSCGADFGRSARQQQLMVALREKALQLSTLTNPLKVANLIDSVGNHVRTDLQLPELQKLAAIIKEVDANLTTTKVLDDTPAGLLTSGSRQFPAAGSILLPKAGAFNYRDIQELAHSLFVDSYIKAEQATIEIKNASPKEGFEAAVAQQLTAYSYHVVATSSVPDRTRRASVIIDRTGGAKPYTIRYLKQRFNATVQSQAKAHDSSAPAEPDIAIVVGSDYNLAATSPATTTPATNP